MIRMNLLASRSAILAAILALGVTPTVPARAAADDPPADSPMVKLLKSGRVPEERQGTVIEMIGRRGTVADLDYIYQRALDVAAPPPIRARALDALAEAATTRGMNPEKDRDKLVGLLAVPATPAGSPLIASSGTGTQPQRFSSNLQIPTASAGSPLIGPVIRLAGAWKLESACGALRDIARSPKVEENVRESAIDALATIGGKSGRSAIEDLAGPGSPMPIRLSTIASLTRLDVDAAAARAAELIPSAVAEGAKLEPLMESFLNHQGGGATLASAIGRHSISPDAAKLALRAVYSLSQADPALVAALGKAAGINTEVKPMTPAELSSLVAEVAAKGDPARGEAVFRRKDLNCLTCHSLSKAGGEIGPDLSAVGQTSPPDYIINAILLPDQSIKEQYHTMVVLTAEGQVYQGIVVDKDNRRVVLKESTGALRSVPVDSIEEQKAGGSLMPKGLVNLMTHAEFVDVVRFLSELGKPGPYAIRTTPTIQRWRVLKSVPPTLVESVPDAEAIRDQVLRAAPDRWASVYAKVSGALPLDEAAAEAGGSKILYVQGELDVTAAGTVRISPRFPDGINFWVDELAAPVGTREFTTSVMPGRRAITVRVDTADRRQRELRFEVDKPAGSTVEFTVVGGK
jgi:putative heme-binding domain-containing protein